MRVLFLIPLMLWFSARPSFGGEINGCKYLIVSDFTQDPYGLAKELRAQAQARGFVVVSTMTEVPPADQLKTCVMTGSWARDLNGGEVSVRVVDLPSGALVAEAAASGGRIGVARTVRFLVGRIYSQLGYTGYSEDVNRQRISREYPNLELLILDDGRYRRKTYGTQFRR